MTVRSRLGSLKNIAKKGFNRLKTSINNKLKSNKKGGSNSEDSITSKPQSKRDKMVSSMKKGFKNLKPNKFLGRKNNASELNNQGNSESFQVKAKKGESISQKARKLLGLDKFTASRIASMLKEFAEEVENIDMEKYKFNDKGKYNYQISGMFFEKFKEVFKLIKITDKNNIDEKPEHYGIKSGIFVFIFYCYREFNMLDFNLSREVNVPDNNTDYIEEYFNKNFHKCISSASNKTRAYMKKNRIIKLMSRFENKKVKNAIEELKKLNWKDSRKGNLKESEVLSGVFDTFINELSQYIKKNKCMSEINSDIEEGDILKLLEKSRNMLDIKTKDNDKLISWMDSVIEALKEPNSPLFELSIRIMEMFGSTHVSIESGKIRKVELKERISNIENNLKEVKNMRFISACDVLNNENKSHPSWENIFKNKFPYPKDNKYEKVLDKLIMDIKIQMLEIKKSILENMILRLKELKKERIEELESKKLSEDLTEEESKELEKLKKERTEKSEELKRGRDEYLTEKEIEEFEKSDKLEKNKMSPLESEVSRLQLYRGSTKDEFGELTIKIFELMKMKINRKNKLEERIKKLKSSDYKTELIEEKDKLEDDINMLKAQQNSIRTDKNTLRKEIEDLESKVSVGNPRAYLLDDLQQKKDELKRIEKSEFEGIELKIKKLEDKESLSKDEAEELESLKKLKLSKLENNMKELEELKSRRKLSESESADLESTIAQINIIKSVEKLKNESKKPEAKQPEQTPAKKETIENNRESIKNNLIDDIKKRLDNFKKKLESMQFGSEDKYTNTAVKSIFKAYSESVISRGDILQVKEYLGIWVANWLFGIDSVINLDFEEEWKKGDKLIEAWTKIFDKLKSVDGSKNLNGFTFDGYNTNKPVKKKSRIFKKDKEPGDKKKFEDDEKEKLEKFLEEISPKIDEISKVFGELNIQGNASENTSTFVDEFVEKLNKTKAAVIKDVDNIQKIITNEDKTTIKQFLNKISGEVGQCFDSLASQKNFEEYVNLIIEKASESTSEANYEWPKEFINYKSWMNNLSSVVDYVIYNEVINSSTKVKYFKELWKNTWGKIIFDISSNESGKFKLIPDKDIKEIMNINEIGAGIYLINSDTKLKKAWENFVDLS